VIKNNDKQWQTRPDIVKDSETMSGTAGLCFTLTDTKQTIKGNIVKQWETLINIASHCHALSYTAMICQSLPVTVTHSYDLPVTPITAIHGYDLPVTAKQLERALLIVPFTIVIYKFS
jgi:hypothetical protein